MESPVPGSVLPWTPWVASCVSIMSSSPTDSGENLMCGCNHGCGSLVLVSSVINLGVSSVVSAWRNRPVTQPSSFRLRDCRSWVKSPWFGLRTAQNGLVNCQSIICILGLMQAHRATVRQMACPPPPQPKPGSGLLVRFFKLLRIYLCLSLI